MPFNFHQSTDFCADIIVVYQRSDIASKDGFLGFPTDERAERSYQEVNLVLNSLWISGASPPLSFVSAYSLISFFRHIFLAIENTYLSAPQGIAMAVQVNLVPLSVDLEKLLAIIKELFSVKLDQEAEDAIKELIDELMKLHDDIVKTLLPFYDIIDDVEATLEKVTAMSAKEYEPLYLFSVSWLKLLEATVTSWV